MRFLFDLGFIQKTKYTVNLFFFTYHFLNITQFLKIYYDQLFLTKLTLLTQYFFFKYSLDFKKKEERKKKEKKQALKQIYYKMFYIA